MYMAKRNMHFLVIFNLKNCLFAVKNYNSVVCCLRTCFNFPYFVCSIFRQVTEAFVPIMTRIKATTTPFGGPKGENFYVMEHEAVWFKGKQFSPAMWAVPKEKNKLKILNQLWIPQAYRLEKSGLPQYGWRML